MFNQKSMIISIAGIAVVFLIGYGAFIYFFVFPENDKEINVKTTRVVKELNISDVRLDLEKGTISPDKDLIVTMKLSGLGDKEMIETLRQDDNLTVELNKKKADIKSTEPDGEDTLIVTAQTKINDDIFRDFNEGKPQDLEVRTDLQYKVDKTATKFINTKYQKGTENSSAGQEISFGKIPKEKDSTSEKQTQTARKTQTAKTPSKRPKPSKKKADAKVVRKRIPPPPSNKRRRTIDNSPPSKSIDRSLIDRLKRNKVRKNTNSN